MAPNPIVVPRKGLNDPIEQKRIDPLHHLCRIPTSVAFASTVVLLVTRYKSAVSWLLSGTPILTYLILVGASYGYRILPFFHLWTLLALINLVYAIAATSWLLRGVFAAGCWSTIVLTTLFQFDTAANFARGRLRSVLSQLQFVDDKIAFFNIPALEIDVDVAGLLVIRGITVSLSSLTVEAHGVEMGIKLTDDMELAIQVESVRVSLFRRVEISDIFANLKGGVYEMTFGKLEESTADEQGNPLMNENTPLLRAASANLDGAFVEPAKIRMTEYMTAGKTPRNASMRTGLQSIKQLSSEDQDALERLNETMNRIQETSIVHQVRKRLWGKYKKDYAQSVKNLRAAICSHLHDTSSVPHPPQQSIKVTTLQSLSSPWVKRFQHRFPLLLRLLLNPIGYFHPVSFSSITATASGQWVRHMLQRHIFKGHAEHGQDLRNLESRMAGWLADANFVVELDDVTGLAQVPVVSDYDINCYLGVKDVLVYRTSPKHIILNEVARFGGADATFTIPTFLLPHHEHILPPKPTAKDKQEIKMSIEAADGKPQQIQATKELEQAEKDETNVQMSVHARLPACFDQELLNFVAALVKATKLVEMEQESDLARPESPTSPTSPTKGFKEFARNLNTSAKDSLKKAMVGGVVNDRWIAKLVGKITKMLETAQGDLGYSGNIPVPLEKYRQKGFGEASKILP